jgi:uncharacterized phage protein (TIGR02218 family)
VKAASPALEALLETDEFDDWTCYTFTMRSGASLLLTEAPFTIKSGATVWPGFGPIVEGGKGGASSTSRAHWRTGTDTDDWKVTVAPRLVDPVTGAANPDTIGGQPFLMALAKGALYRADTTVQRAYFDPATVLSPGPVAGQTPVGFMTMIRGLVADVEIVNGQVTITIMDYLKLLRTQMPWRIYQAGCQVTLFDSLCKLSAAAFACPGAVTGVTSRSTFATSATVSPPGSGTYELGRVAFTSGLNAGLQHTIQSWDGAHTVTVSPPFPFAVQTGDAVTLYPGCNHTTAHCTAFGNLVNYGLADPFIPPPTTTNA